MTQDTSFLFQSGTTRSISKADLADLPIRRFEGEIHIVETEDALARAAADIRRDSVVGLDTETRPSFAKGESHLPCLVQAATDRAVYLFPLRYTQSHGLLIELLEAAGTVKAGVALAYDLRALLQVFPFRPTSILDLGGVARRGGYEQTGLRNLAGIFLDFRIAKGTRTSNWAAQRLTRQQIAYAATDAWACRELYLRFETLGLLD